MTDNTDELFEWHLAFLRQSAYESKSSNLTPMSLINRDRDLMDQLISAAAEKQAAATRAESAASNKIPYQGLKDKLSIICASGLCLCALAESMQSHSILTTVLLLGIMAFLIWEIFFSKRSSVVDASLRLPLSRFSSDANPNKLLADCLPDKIISELLQRIVVMEQKEKLIFDCSSLVLCELNKDGSIIRVNENAESIWDYRREEIYGAPLTEILSIDSKPKLAEILLNCKASQQAVQQELRVRRKNGDLADLLWRVEWSGKADAFFCRAEDITERRNAERLKAEVTAMINHDLKAPVTSFYYALHNMLDGLYGELPESLEEAAELCLRNMRTVLSLLDNLNNAQKLESGELKPNRSHFQVQDCFDQVSELLHDWCKAANLTFVVEPTTAGANADLEQCIRILSNLCANAIKWSPTGSTIFLRAISESNFVIIEVQDSGPGLSSESLETLFQRWGTGASLRGQISSSTGLGLYIAKKFAELQGGSIGVKSAPDKGAIFWFSIPS